MRVTKSLAFLVTLWVIGLYLIAPSVSANSLTPGTGSIADALKDISTLLKQAATLQKELADLNLALRNDVDGLFDLIDKARNVLLACDGQVDCEDQDALHSASVLLEQAQRDKAFVLVVQIESFLDFLHEFEVGIGDLEGVISGLKENGRIPVSEGMFMEIQLDSCNKIITMIDLETAEVSALLEDGDAGEDPNDPNSADDVNDFIAIALHGLLTPGGLDAVDPALDDAEKKIDEARAVKDNIHTKLVPSCRSALKQVQKKLSRLARLARVRLASETFALTHTSFRVEGAALVRAQVYTLSGQRVSETQVTGDTLSLNTAALANGTYLVVATGLSREGQTVSSAVQKLVVLR